MTSQIDYQFSLADKVAVVTGGASGIGAAIVDAYAAKGATVVVLDKAVDAAQHKVSDGSAAAAFGCDVTNEQSVVDAVSAVKTQFGRIDVLVNSAGSAVTVQKPRDCIGCSLACDRVRELCPQKHEQVLRRAHGKSFDRVRQDVGALASG